MKLQNRLLAFTGVLTLMVATPATGQAFFFPDYALPSANGSSSTFVAGSYGRGLNDVSQKVNAFAGTVGRTMRRVSFQAGGGYTRRLDRWTVGGAAGFDLINNIDSSVQLTFQGGLGWISYNILGETLTNLRFPIGLALKGHLGGSGVQIAPWVMPRLNVVQASIAGISTMSWDLGVSGGLAITGQSGFGIHTAVDYLADGLNPIVVSVGTHYVLGR